MSFIGVKCACGIASVSNIAVCNITSAQQLLMTLMSVGLSPPAPQMTICRFMNTEPCDKNLIVNCFVGLSSSRERKHSDNKTEEDLVSGSCFTKYKRVVKIAVRPKPRKYDPREGIGSAKKKTTTPRERLLILEGQDIEKQDDVAIGLTAATLEKMILKRDERIKTQQILHADPAAAVVSSAQMKVDKDSSLSEPLVRGLSGEEGQTGNDVRAEVAQSLLSQITNAPEEVFTTDLQEPMDETTADSRKEIIDERAKDVPIETQVVALQDSVEKGLRNFMDMRDNTVTELKKKNLTDHAEVLEGLVDCDMTVSESFVRFVPGSKENKSHSK